MWPRTTHAEPQADHWSRRVAREDLKQFILRSTQIFERLHTQYQHRQRSETDRETKTKEGKRLELVRVVLVPEAVIRQAKSEKIDVLIDYCNTIAHTIHVLTADIGANSHSDGVGATGGRSIPAYDYTAARRARGLRRRVIAGIQGKFVLSVSLGPVAFEAAEKTSIAEVEHFKLRVNIRIDLANRVIADVNQ